MRSLQNIDAQVVGSICADSSTYCSISDVFKMNNLVSDIRSILSGKKTYVGRLHGDNSKNIEIKFHKTEVRLNWSRKLLWRKSISDVANQRNGSNQFCMVLH